MIILSQRNFTHDWELYLLHLCKRRRELERCEFEEMYEDNREMGLSLFYLRCDIRCLSIV